MSFPGWLDESYQLKELPVRWPLPITHEATYLEGSDGVILRGTGTKWIGDWAFVDTGVILSEGYGVDGETPVLNIVLRQPYVFGVMLFDWFQPPKKLQTKPQYSNTIDEGVPYESGATEPVFTPTRAGTTPTFTEVS